MEHVQLRLVIRTFTALVETSPWTTSIGMHEYIISSYTHLRSLNINFV